MMIEPNRPVMMEMKMCQRLISMIKRGIGIVLIDDRLGLHRRYGANTLILSKRSLLAENPVVKTGDGQTAAVKIVAQDEVNDLVLLATDLRLEHGISVSTIFAGDSPVRLGEFLLSPHPLNEGEVSVVGSGSFASQRKLARKRRGFLGVQPDAGQQDKVVLEQVIPDTAAEKAGLKEGDVIVSLNGQALSSPDDLINRLSGSRAGDSVALVVMRDGSELSMDVTLGKNSSRGGGPRHAADFFEGGKSEIRNGFSKVIAHDARVLAQECGGPVFDIRGNLVGFNIARVSRTHCFMLPASVIEDFLNGLVADASDDRSHAGEPNR